MDTLEVLTKTYELLSDPNRWSRRGFGSAKNKHGATVCSTASDACAWDLLGALQKFQGSFNSSVYDILDNLCVKRGFDRGDVGSFNNKSTHDDVMLVLHEAIAEVLNQQSK